MSNRSIVPNQARFIVTPEGRAAASAEESCQCRFGRVANMLVCWYCLVGYELRRPQAAPVSREKSA